jgi:transcription antitermination factor NusG
VTCTGEATHFQSELVQTWTATSASEHSWFAIQTKTRHEKRVAVELQEKGVAVFLPLSTEVHQWSDRKRTVELPLFTNYVFVRIGIDRNTRVEVLQTNGVFRFVGIRGMGVAIPDEQIETVQAIVRRKIPFSPHPFLAIGQKVRVRGGSLDGLKGILQGLNGDQSLIISVESIQRSLAIRIAGYQVEAA